jgi:hypothetical protein
MHIGIVIDLADLWQSFQSSVNPNFSSMVLALPVKERQPFRAPPPWSCRLLFFVHIVLRLMSHILPIVYPSSVDISQPLGVSTR